MNADLEEQLKELGTDCRAVVNRLRSAKTVEMQGEGQGQRSRSTVEWLVAASLLVALGLSIVFLDSQSSIFNLQPSPAYGAREYHLSVPEMIATQNPDGSWQNDFLTRRNAEALARCEGQAARIAYKKAMRNLRARGIL